MIEKMPLELEPPSPMSPPPLRRRPSPTPQISMTPTEKPSLRLFVDERWN